MELANRKDVILANKPYTVKSYLRGTTDDMVARFGSSEKGQTNLDLLKAETQISFRGGQFQALFNDAEMVNSIEGMYYNENDQKLYLAADFVQEAGPTTGIGEQVTAWCFHNGKLYFSVYSSYWTGGDTNGNKLFAYDPDTETVSAALTLTAAITSTSVPITSLCSHGSHIFIAGKDPTGFFRVHRYNPSSNTCVNLGSDPINGRYLTSFRGKLYMIGLSGLNLITNEFSSGTLTSIKNVGQNDPDIINTNNMFVFNGALWIAKTDGLFRYDGVEVVQVLNDSRQQLADNFKYSEVFNGAIYYTKEDTLWRFDGVNVEKLQDLSGVGRVVSLAARDDRLWILLSAPRDNRFDSPTGGAKDIDESNAFTLIAYNGVGFYTYKTFSNLSAYEFVVPIVAVAFGRSYVIMPEAYLNASLEPRHSTPYIYKFTHSDEFTQLNAQTSGTVTSSRFAFGYPAVDKVLCGTGFSADDLLKIGVVAADFGKSRLRVYVRYFDEKSRVVNTTIGATEYDKLLVYDTNNAVISETDSIGSDYYLFDELSDMPVEASGLASKPFIGRQFEYILQVDAEVDEDGSLYEGFVPRIRDFSLRYTLQPRARKTWQLTLGLMGNDSSGINNNIDGTDTATTLRRILYEAYENKQPILFYDIDRSKVIGIDTYSDPDYTLDTRSVDLTVAGEPFYAVGDSLAVETVFDGDTAANWWTRRIVDLEANGTDTLVRFSQNFGRRGNIGGYVCADTVLVTDVSVGDVVRRAYAVQVVKIPTERVIMDENNENSDDKQTHFQSEISVILTEV